MRYPTSIPPTKPPNPQILEGDPNNFGASPSPKGLSLPQELGFGGDVGYQTFLYSSEHDTRRLLLFLVEKLPRDEGERGAEPPGTCPGWGAEILGSPSGRFGRGSDPPPRCPLRREIGGAAPSHRSPNSGAAGDPLGAPLVPHAPAAEAAGEFGGGAPLLIREVLINPLSLNERFLGQLTLN